MAELRGARYSTLVYRREIPNRPDSVRCAVLPDFSLAPRSLEPSSEPLQLFPDLFRGQRLMPIGASESKQGILTLLVLYS
jgi:hypothetical protein